MRRKAKYYIAIKIGSLTNSIVNSISGDSFQTVITEVSKEDLKAVTKKMAGNLTGKVNLN